MSESIALKSNILTFTAATNVLRSGYDVLKADKASAIEPYSAVALCSKV